MSLIILRKRLYLQAFQHAADRFRRRRTVTFMGIIRATTRPYYYTQLEQTPPTISKLEPLETGMISLAFRVAGTGYYLGNHQQRKLESVISPALGEKATYVRDYVTSDNRGF